MSLISARRGPQHLVSAFCVFWMKLHRTDYTIEFFTVIGMSLMDIWYSNIGFIWNYLYLLVLHIALHLFYNFYGAIESLYNNNNNVHGPATSWDTYVPSPRRLQKHQKTQSGQRVSPAHHGGTGCLNLEGAASWTWPKWQYKTQAMSPEQQIAERQHWICCVGMCFEGNPAILG